VQRWSWELTWLHALTLHALTPLGSLGRSMAHFSDRRPTTADRLATSHHHLLVALPERALLEKLAPCGHHDGRPNGPESYCTSQHYGHHGSWHHVLSAGCWGLGGWVVVVVGRASCDLPDAAVTVVARVTGAREARAAGSQQPAAREHCHQPAQPCPCHVPICPTSHTCRHCDASSNIPAALPVEAKAK
jgi:hypothetical protein